MKELQRKQRIRRALYSIPSLVVLTILAAMLLKGAVGVVARERESAARSKELESKAAALILREQELEDGIARLATEEGIEDEIRERFSVTQEGEHVAVIVDEKRAATSTDTGVP